MKSGKCSLRVTLLLIVREFLFASLLFSPLVTVVTAQTTSPKRVVVLYWDNKDFPGNIRFDEAFQSQLRSLTSTVEYYPEYFESSRFPGEQFESSFNRYLRDKYAGHPVDVVVASADAPLGFLLKHRTDLFSSTPIVFVANRPPDSKTLEGAGAVTGINNQTTHRETVELALKLHPDTTKLFVVSGTPQRDLRFESVAREELSAFANEVSITYVTDLSLSQLINTTRSLPPHSLILYLWQQATDENGRLLESYEVLQRVASQASAPTYSMGTVSLGSGMVGGYLQGPEMNGARVAEMVAQVLNGTRAQDIPIERARQVPMFDWRALKRWSISEQSLPAGSVVRFKEFTFWEQYKWRIILVLSLIALQSIFIGVLLVERGRRRRAKEALDRLNNELEQRIAARTAALNAKSRELETFAYSVAHDLKAPLRGIDGYGRLLLEDHSAQLNDEAQMFLRTIQDSTQEMSQLIDDLLEYSRLERRDFQSDRVELGPLITTVVEQKRRDTSETEIDFVMNVNGGVVVADRRGLTQSLSNYLDNAVKFSGKVSNPRVEVGSQEKANSFLVWVRDNGVGFDMKYHDRIFDIFQRLNRSEEYPGTGVGLAIVRKAMERMGGRAWADSQPGEGATFYLEIPK
ncbi:MAG TPA: ABC transporter substrate binding protein [Pyrinomonadaceae bacterium]|nr:ABC transporter substrate binding protein [Pyrinomonadaceae bacterium]